MSPELAEAIRRRNLDVKPDPDSTENSVIQKLGRDIDGQLLGSDPRLEAIFPELGGIATQPADIEPVDPQESTI